jgi:hypothetical protein
MCVFCLLCVFSVCIFCVYSDKVCSRGYVGYEANNIAHDEKETNALAVSHGKYISLFRPF